MAAAGDQRLQFDPLVDHQRAGPLRSAELVRRQSHGMHAGDVQCAEVEATFAEGLHRVRVKPRPQGFGMVSKRHHILHGTCLVVGQHDRNQRRLVVDCGFKVGTDDAAVFIDRNLAQPPAGALQRFCRLTHTGMFDGRDRHRTRCKAGRRALDEQVVGFRPAAGEYHLGGMRANGKRHPLPRLIDRAPCRTAILVTTGGITILHGQIRQHAFQHARVERRGGVVIEIDRGEHGGYGSPSGGDQFLGRATHAPQGPFIVDHGGGAASLALLRDEFSQGHRAEVLEHFFVQAGPQFVRHARPHIFRAIALAATIRRIERLVDRMNDVGNGNRLQGLGQVVATTGSANAGNQLAATQFAEQLLEVGKGNLLPLADAGERYRTGMLAQCKIDHRGYGKTSFGRQSHGNLRRVSAVEETLQNKYLSDSINYIVSRSF